jgi:molybdopterin-guanine dinucleotide biosynthesis protein A
MHRVTAAILAGGQARRFGGRDKSGLMVGGRSILARQLETLSSLAADVILVADAAARYAGTGIRVVEDRYRGAGPLGGIHAALVASPDPAVLVVASDMPFLNRAVLERLVTAVETDQVDAAVPRSIEGPQPLCAVYLQSCIEPFRRRLESHAWKVVDALADLRVVELTGADLERLDPGGLAFFNINTPDDHRRASGVVGDILPADDGGAGELPNPG